jgi:hypothetical protein
MINKLIYVLLLALCYSWLAIGQQVEDTKFSHDRGIYYQPIDVAISSATSGAILKYTLDGSTPSEINGTLYNTPINIDKTAILRAMAYLSDGSLSNTDVDTHTYIFPASVLQQSRPEGYPTLFSNNTPSDYEMDPDVYNDPSYSTSITNDLLEAPILSIVTDKDNLFSSSIGIYLNPGSRGDAWERPISAEFIYPKNGKTKSFHGHQGESLQIDCGLRMQGAASRSTGIVF